MKRYLLMTALAMMCATVHAQESTPSFSIIPEPVEAIAADGQFAITRETQIVVSGKDVHSSADFLMDYLNHYLGYPLKMEKKAKGSNCISLVNKKNGEVPGGYTLEVSANGIAIEGNDAAGVFYGMQTLIQLLPTRAGVLPVLQAVKVRDYPRFEYRGMHLDVVRHYFPVSYIRKYLDYMALHKLNYFHWHLTDDQAWRIEMKSHPRLTESGSNREGEIEGLYPGVYKELPYGGYYTQEEAKEIIAYAAERHITVIPEIDIPGHCMAVLATYPHFSTIPDEPKKAALTWGIYNKFNNVLAPTPEVFRFLKDVFSELCDIFPGQYVHVGGDECAKRWWQESEQTQQFMKEKALKDEKALQSYFIHYVQDVVNAKGKTLIGWDEILEGGIDRNCVIMNWRRVNHAVNAARKGNRVIMTSSAYSYFNKVESRSQAEIGAGGVLPLRKVYDFQLIPEELTEEEAGCIWGAQGCLWTEYIPTTWKVEFSIFPRMSALAENAWSTNGKGWENFVRKMEAQFARYDLWGARYSETFFRVNDVPRKR